MKTTATTKSLLTAIVGLMLMGQVGSAQQPQPPTFRASTRLIVQTGTVTDANGKTVEGLAPRDFTVTEEGVAQSIAFVEFQRFDPERLPAITAAPPSVPAADTAPS